jgi:hypothetical protein
VVAKTGGFPPSDETKQLVKSLSACDAQNGVPNSSYDPGKNQQHPQQKNRKGDKKNKRNGKLQKLNRDTAGSSQPSLFAKHETNRRPTTTQRRRGRNRKRLVNRFLVFAKSGFIRKVDHQSVFRDSNCFGDINAISFWARLSH